MPAQILPMLDLGEQARNEQQNALKSQQLQMQEQYQNALTTLRQQKQQNDEAMAPLHQQLLQQELANQQTAGQISAEQLKQLQFNGPIDRQLKEQQYTSSQDEMTSRALQRQLAQKTSDREDDSQRIADLRAVQDTETHALQQKLGTQALDANASEVLTHKLGQVAGLLTLDPEVRIPLLANFSGVLDPNTLAALAKAPAQSSSNDEVARRYLNSKELAQLQQAETAVREKVDTRNKVEQETGTVPPTYMKSLDRIGELVKEAYDKRDAASKKPNEIPMNSKGEIELGKLIKGVVYQVNPQMPPMVFTGMGSNGKPQWARP